jgi:inner membrane protein
MATSFGHYLVGLSVTRALARDAAERKRGLWVAAVACLPDLDIVPGLLIGRLNAFHHGVSHSFAAAAVFSLLTSLLLIRTRLISLKLSVLLFLVYGSHLILDFLTLDTGPPHGIPLFWPISHETYQSPWVLLPNVQHTRAPLLSPHNVWLIGREAMIFLPLIGFIRALKHPKTAWRLRHAWFFGGWFILALWASVLSLHQG